jgi:arylsulfatase A-like enzyme
MHPSGARARHVLDSPIADPVRVRDALLLGAAAGLGLGLVEILFLAIKKFLFHRYLHLNPQIGWLGPLAYGIAFAGLAVLITLVLARLRGPLRVQVITFVVVTLGSSGALFAIGGIHRGAFLLLGAGIGLQVARVATRAWPRIRAGLGRFVLAAALAVLVLGLGMNLLLAFSGRGGGPPVTGAKNVLWVIWDTVRSDNLSVYGYDRPTSPTLEGLARRGVTFDHAFAPSPWTLPSHASMFTGQPPHALDAGWRTPLEHGSITVAEIARANGFRTGGFIANLFYASRESGLARGFSTWVDYPVATVPEFLRSTALARSAFDSSLNPLRLLRRMRGGVSDMEPDRAPALSAEATAPHDRSPEIGQDRPAASASRQSLLGRIGGWLGRLQNESRKWAPQVNDEFLAWLERDSEQPFFAVLNYFDAHDPYRPPAPFDTTFGAAPPLAMAEGREYTEAEVRRLIGKYDASIAYLDHHFAALLERLETLGVLDNTVLIVTSDHGEEFGEHRVFTHAHSLYQPSLRVPLLIVSPGSVPAAHRVDSWVTITELASTVLELAGLDPNAVPGRSLSRFWTAPDSTFPISRPDTLRATVLYSWAVPEWYPISRGDMESVFADPWKYIRNGDGSEELYDLRADPGETSNLHTSDRAPGVLPALRAVLGPVSPDQKGR